MARPETIPQFNKAIIPDEESRRTRETVTNIDWNSLFNAHRYQGNHSENYLESLDKYLFDTEQNGEVVSLGKFTQIQEALDQQANLLLAHRNDSNNPHSVRASQVPVEPIVGVVGAEAQSALANLKAQIDTKLSNTAASGIYDTLANASVYIVNASLDTETGIMTYTRNNGTTFTINTGLSRIATNITFDETTQKLILHFPDGTTQAVDLSAFIVPTEFVNSGTIQFSVSGSTVSASLNPAVAETINLALAACEDYKEAAGISANSASASALDASTYKDNAQGSATLAAQKATDASTSAGNASAAMTSAQSAQQQANNSALTSEAWAVETKNGVPVSSSSAQYHNSAKYWAERARAISNNELAGLTDVSISSPTNGQALTYNSALQKWVNGEGAGLPVSGTELIKVLFGSFDSTQMVFPFQIVEYQDHLWVWQSETYGTPPVDAPGTQGSSWQRADSVQVMEAFPLSMSWLLAELLQMSQGIETVSWGDIADFWNSPHPCYALDFYAHDDRNDEYGTMPYMALKSPTNTEPTLNNPDWLYVKPFTVMEWLIKILFRQAIFLPGKTFARGEFIFKPEEPNQFGDRFGTLYRVMAPAVTGSDTLVSGQNVTTVLDILDDIYHIEYSLADPWFFGNAYYDKGAYVSYCGSLYRAKQEVRGEHNPATDTAYWQQMQIGVVLKNHQTGLDNLLHSIASEWDSQTALYPEGSYVTYNYYLYKAKQAVIGSHTPTETAYWQKVTIADALSNLSSVASVAMSTAAGAMESIAPEFGDLTTYAPGALVQYDYKLYKCIQACTGVYPYNTSYWQRTTLAQEL